MEQRVCLGLTILLLLTGNASAFDGKHEGFTLGINLGSHDTNYSEGVLGFEFPAQTKSGLA